VKSKSKMATFRGMDVAPKLVEDMRGDQCGSKTSERFVLIQQAEQYCTFVYARTYQGGDNNIIHSL
jgi:hypothetical protein